MGSQPYARYAAVLWILTLLFGLRVVGQMLVAFFGVTFLPPMPEWYSGLVPYPLLLPVQIAILLIQTRINFGVARGWNSGRSPRLGLVLVWFSAGYFAVMLLRYILTMAWYPERRWLGGTIPIVFHWVLAAYLCVLGRYCLTNSATNKPAA